MTKSAKEFKYIKPAPGYLVVEQQKASEKTAAGIYLPDSANKEKPSRGKVVYIGAEYMSDYGQSRKAPANVGEMIIYKKWGGTEIELNGKEYVFVNFSDVLGIEK